LPKDVAIKGYFFVCGSGKGQTGQTNNAGFFLKYAKSPGKNAE